MHGTSTDSLNVEEQVRVPYALIRGGTSKGVFLRAEVLPADAAARDRMILSLFGSPDPRQIDGLGGADLLTSKLAIIGPPSRTDADLDYTFAQVSINDPVVDYDINCGNLSAAVGAFAVDEGLVTPTEPITTVRIHNTNTGRILVAGVPIRGGRAAIEGEYVVHGVPGTGAPISLDFGQTAGGITGSLFPTGRESDILDTEVGPVEATIIDLANLSVFFPAAAVGLAGTERPGQMTEAQFAAVDAVKGAAAKMLGMEADGLTPVPAFVAPPAPFVDYSTGRDVGAGEIDLLARVIGGRPPVLHKAYPGTLAATTGVAASIPGTVVNDVYTPQSEGLIRIGHTSGVMPVRARVHRDDGAWIVDEAIYHRTSRRLAEGVAFLRTAALAGDDE